MKKVWIVAVAAIALLVGLTGCQMDAAAGSEAFNKGVPNYAPAKGLVDNPSGAAVPEATVDVAGIPAASKASRSIVSPAARVESAGTGATLEPASFAARLMPGQSVAEKLTATLPAEVMPRRGDILISFDLTGSMGGALNNMKANAQNIIASVRGEIPDTDFGVISHMDYNGSYPYNPANPGALTSYGSGPDYPYRLGLGMTSDATAVQNAINALALGYGNDGPECYSRALYEAYADPNVGWRTGSKKILIAWADAMPHDYDYNAILGVTKGSTGTDPGRDAVVGTADDLAILDVLDGLKANNVTLITLCSNASLLPLWKAYSERTGGSAFAVNYDGTIPGGTPIGPFIAGLITEQVKHIGSVGLEVREEAYKGWMNSVTPASYGDVYLDGDKTFGFDVGFTVPAGTPDGEHVFHVGFVGDGALYAEHEVRITVYHEIAVTVDIKPGSCSNPFNVNSCGYLPVAIKGTADFDVKGINVCSIELEGVGVHHYSFEDVLGCDGVLDLMLHIPSWELGDLLDDYSHNATVTLTLRGTMKDGTPIVGTDTVRIINPCKRD